MDKNRQLGTEHWLLQNRTTLTIIPTEKKPPFKDIVYLLQDFNSLYTKLVLVSKGSYKAALASPSYRRRFQAITPDEQLVIIAVERGSLLKLTLEGLGQTIDALRRLIELFIKGRKHIRVMSKLEQIEKAASILKDISKIKPEQTELENLAKVLIRETRRLVENPNMIEVTSSSQDIRETLGGKYLTTEENRELGFEA